MEQNELYSKSWKEILLAYFDACWSVKQQSDDFRCGLISSTWKRYMQNANMGQIKHNVRYSLGIGLRRCYSREPGARFSKVPENNGPDNFIETVIGKLYRAGSCVSRSTR